MRTPRSNFYAARLRFVGYFGNIGERRRATADRSMVCFRGILLMQATAEIDEPPRRVYRWGRSTWLWTIVRVNLHVVVWGLGLLVLRFFAPRFTEFFAGYDTSLPAISLLVLQVSQLVVDLWPVVVLLFAIAVFVDVLVDRALSRGGRRWTRRAWFWTLWLGSAGAVVIATAAIWLPFLEIFERV